MGQSDGELKTLVIDGVPYLVPEPVYELLLTIAQEKDAYVAALAAIHKEK